MPPKAELEWWYQYYFATERGRAGYDKYRRDFNQLIWRRCVAAMGLRRRDVRAQRGVLRQPGSRRIVIHNYRWRLGLAEGEAQYDELETAARPRSSRSPSRRSRWRATPTARRIRTERLRRKFTGAYEHRVIEGGVGHNLPQEAPRAFAQAIIDVGGVR